MQLSGWLVGWLVVLEKPPIPSTEHALFGTCVAMEGKDEI
jgi:hypothetical protein